MPPTETSGEDNRGNATVSGEWETLERFWTETTQRVNAELERLLPPASVDPMRLHQAMRHAVMAGGKRLRPALIIAAHRALGGNDPNVYPLAAAIEMLHTYSLIHDDLPCMDDDDQRRGQPTVHVAFDEATAVLAGDALHVLAFEVLATVAPPVITREIAIAIGTSGMLGGQMADLEAEGKPATEPLVSSIHRRKTGALIIASAKAGARLANASDSELDAVERYARPLGLAFQIVDDLLEVTGDPALLGKPVQSDEKHHKVTYPAAIGIEAARERAETLAGEAKSALAKLSGDMTILAAIADFIVHRDR
jgi:geranylgeranyl pyrophosphate synthase